MRQNTNHIGGRKTYLKGLLQTQSRQTPTVALKVHRISENLPNVYVVWCLKAGAGSSAVTPVQPVELYQ